MRFQPYEMPDVTIETEASTRPGLKLNEVQARYWTIYDEFRTGEADSLWYNIIQKFSYQLSHAKVPKMSRGCVGINIGSFTSPQYGRVLRHENRPIYHLVALEIMKGILESYQDKAFPPDRVFFHDPEMNELDRRFLKETRGYESNPAVEVNSKITHDMFVYMPCATFEYIRDLFAVEWPCIFVGMDLREWPEYLKPKPEHDDVRNAELARRYSRNLKTHREVYRAYFDTTCEQKLVIMKETYQFPTVTVYCKIKAPGSAARPIKIDEDD